MKVTPATVNTQPARGRAKAMADRRRSRWFLAALLVAPLLIMAGKNSHYWWAPLLNEWFTPPPLALHLRQHVEYMLLVPMGAVIVSLVRLTFGVRVLSLFRPILTAIAFHIIGIPLGTAFLIVVMAGLVALRPLVRGGHYYARVPVQLSLVAVFMMVPLVLTKWWHAAWLEQLSYFPIISLCLICEGFSKKLHRRGLGRAIRVTGNTVGVAMIIVLVAKIPGFMSFLLRYPELLIVQVGLIFVIAEYLNFRLFAKKKKRSSKHSAAAPSPPCATGDLSEVVLQLK